MKLKTPYNKKVKKIFDRTDSRNLKERYDRNELTTIELLDRLKKFTEEAEKLNDEKT